MNYAQDPETFLTPDNLQRLHRQRSQFFKMPRGNPGVPGSLTHRHWKRRAEEVRDAGRAYHNGEISFYEAARRALQAHLELEQYRNAHGTRAPRERRSVLLTQRPIALSEPDDPSWLSGTPSQAAFFA